MKQPSNLNRKYIMSFSKDSDYSTLDDNETRSTWSCNSQFTDKFRRKKKHIKNIISTKNKPKQK